jgi:hypothetical protein
LVRRRRLSCHRSAAIEGAAQLEAAAVVEDQVRKQLCAQGHRRHNTTALLLL